MISATQKLVDARQHRLASAVRIDGQAVIRVRRDQELPLAQAQQVILAQQAIHGLRLTAQPRRFSFAVILGHP